MTYLLEQRHILSFFSPGRIRNTCVGLLYLFGVIQSEKLRHGLLEFNQDDQLKRGSNIFVLFPDFPSVIESTVYYKY